MHARETIELAIVAALTDLPNVDTAANVFREPEQVIPEGRLPCIVITDAEEDSERSRGPVHEHSLTLAIEVMVKQLKDQSSAINAIMVEIEKALYSDPSLQALIGNRRRISAFTRVVDGELEQPVMRAMLSFMLQYRTSELDPETLV